MAGVRNLWSPAGDTASPCGELDPQEFHPATKSYHWTAE